MNLNYIAKMSEEELEHVIEIAQKELVRRFERFSVGLKVNISSPDCPLEIHNKFLKGKKGRIYGTYVEDGKRFYEILIDSSENLSALNRFWDFEAYEISPYEPPPTIITAPPPGAPMPDWELFGPGY